MCIYFRNLRQHLVLQFKPSPSQSLARATLNSSSSAPQQSIAFSTQPSTKFYILLWNSHLQWDGSHCCAQEVKEREGQHKIKHCYKVPSQPIHSGTGRWHLERLCILILSVTFLLLTVEVYLTLGGTRVRSFSEAPCFNPLQISTGASCKCQTTSLGVSLITSLPISIKISQLRFAVL